MKCPLRGRKTRKPQTQEKGQPTPVDPMFSNVRNICIHCRGDHAPDSCPMKTCLHATQDAAGYQMYNNGARQVRLTLITLLLLAQRTADRLLQTCLQVLQRTREEPKDVLLAPESKSHLRLVPTLRNRTAIMCCQCTPPILSHHLLISQFHSRHHLLHPLMHLMHIQPLCQTFQLHSA